MKKAKVLCVLLFAVCSALVQGQVERPELMQRPELTQRGDGSERFELGRRLRAVEAAWDANADAAARKRAGLLLKSAVGKFFGAQPGEAGRSLDQARFLLDGGDLTPARLWAESLYLKPASRFTDTAEPTLSFTLQSFYAVPAPLPAGAQLRVWLAIPRKSVPSWVGEIKEVPLTQQLVVRGGAAGDYALLYEITLNGKVLASGSQTVSLAGRLALRLAQLRLNANALSVAATDAATARYLLEMLEKLSHLETLETNFPAAKLLQEAENIVAAAQKGQSVLGRKREGEFWLSLQLDEKDALPVRLAAPQTAETGQPLPLVIALHGAGGSENLFFDGYGRGAAVRLAQQRGWLIVSPRNFGFDAARLALLIDSVAELYPVDRKRVFLIGHSLGAMQAVALASNMADKLAGVAALGGGGRPRGYEDLQPLPFFIGVGDADFALGSATVLKKALEQIGVRRVVYHEYADVEHLAIVQVALPDVFAFFDEIAARR